MPIFKFYKIHKTKSFILNFSIKLFGLLNYYKINDFSRVSVKNPSLIISQYVCYTLYCSVSIPVGNSVIRCVFAFKQILPVSFIL